MINSGGYKFFKLSRSVVSLEIRYVEAFFPKLFFKLDFYTVQVFILMYDNLLV